MDRPRDDPLAAAYAITEWRDGAHDIHTFGTRRARTLPTRWPTFDDFIVAGGRMDDNKVGRA